MFALGAVKLMDFTTVIHYMATVLNLDCFNNSALYMTSKSTCPVVQDVGHIAKCMVSPKLVS